ncbi:MAG: ribonuclease P protein component [Flavobacteriales bacterium]|jgi:ribonuclease P protein component|nr:ribonuclease P protein component [Flavobacteriales bacterium]MCO5276276.1 ribonuclease P protein component [Flavobacteriales bacterium]HRN37590.1 ribonuclease P protein component [Flavobacteriales bacterium]HRO38486.1 ribonuclease P protein component [Flavobacteriales bacterium]HRP82099.1 ribonuclease P protein component [Flavobacteriales bacterium]
MRHTFRKHERLTGRVVLKQVATTGKSLKSHPFRLQGLLMPLDTASPAQVAFSVPKRLVRSAVQRNRIRRHMREAYRLNKHRWHACLQEAGAQCAWLVVFQGHAPLPWAHSSKILIGLFDRWTQQHVGADR